jgi:class 3 adenylate cyclase
MNTKPEQKVVVGMEQPCSNFSSFPSNHQIDRKLTCFSRLLWLALLCLVFTFPVTVSAQEGNPYITNFHLSDHYLDNQNWSICQDKNDVMLFANRRGVLCYNGYEWKLVETPNFPYAVAKDPSSNRIFVGCKNDFGYLKKDDKGIYGYFSLSEDYNFPGEIISIEITETDIYFYSELTLTRVSLKNYDDKAQWKSEADAPFLGIIRLKDHIVLNQADKGLFKIRNSKKTPVTSDTTLTNSQLLFGIPIDAENTLVGTDLNQLFLYDGRTFKDYAIEAQEYLSESVLSGGVMLSEDRFAISTLSGGCIIADINTGKTVFTLNYQTGLPDDEIYAIGKDRNNGLWISHEFGISRIDYMVPVRRYDSYPGLEGNLTAVLQHQGTTYVATSEGVFYLSEAKNYEELEVLIRVKRKRDNRETKGKPVVEEFKENNGAEIGDSTPKSKKEQRQKEKETRKEKRKETFQKLKFWKKKKKDKNAEEADETATNESPEPEPKKVERKKRNQKEKVPEAIVIEPEYETTYVSKKIYALQSISHVFKKVEGLNRKCKQLIPFGTKILVATNTGLYEIGDSAAVAIIEGHNINTVAASVKNNRFFIGTSSGLFAVAYNSSTGQWEKEFNFESIEQDVHSILEFDENELWIGCDNIAFRALLNPQARPYSVKGYDFDVQFSERVLVRNINNKPIFFLSNGLYHYDAEEDNVFIDEHWEEQLEADLRFIASQEKITWLLRKNSWTKMHSNSELEVLKAVYLKLFNDIQNIYVDADNNMWIIDADNSLYKVRGNDYTDTERAFDIFINRISDYEGTLFSLSTLELSDEENALRFNLSAPTYLKLNSTQYQYRIDGLMTNWSQWNSNPNIDIPYVPPGKYVLRIRARNILGQVTKEKKFNFKITTPFYSTWPFYLGCVLVIILLIFIIIRLRERALRRRQHILEQKVTMRTSQLTKEKKKSEELLLNILPKETADELKLKGKSEPRHYELATVLFTDFKNFTKIAEDISPKDLIAELDVCFLHFDEIIDKYNIEKIKTIGDSYMCAGGIPIKNKNNPIEVTLAALEILDFMTERKRQKESKGISYWEVRIGIHTGPLIAGVVGKKKFAYDIWGDTVNTASRLESESEAGNVNISESTFAHVRDYFECSSRGKVEAKNKGKIEMYYVNAVKRKYSFNNDGRRPNEDLLNIIEQE